MNAGNIIADEDFAGIGAVAAGEAAGTAAAAGATFTGAVVDVVVVVVGLFSASTLGAAASALAAAVSTLGAGSATSAFALEAPSCAVSASHLIDAVKPFSPATTLTGPAHPSSSASGT